MCGKYDRLNCGEDHLSHTPSGSRPPFFLHLVPAPLYKSGILAQSQLKHYSLPIIAAKSICDSQERFLAFHGLMSLWQSVTSLPDSVLQHLAAVPRDDPHAGYTHPCLDTRWSNSRTRAGLGRRHTAVRNPIPPSEKCTWHNVHNSLSKRQHLLKCILSRHQRQ